MSREVLLTGSVPRSPASEVFRLAESHLGPYLTRLPDGEQGGWGGGTIAAAVTHPQLQPGPSARMTTANTPFGQFPEMTMMKLADGVAAEEFSWPVGSVADNKISSYLEFREMKERGDIAEGVRFQATIPGPATAGGTLYMPLSVGVRSVGKAQIGEIEKLLAAIPHDELAIQLDLAVEVEMIEIERRPDAFSAPIFHVMGNGWGDWSFDDVVEEVALVAEAVPEDVELGFHLCGMWHIDPAGGQDIDVHVDWANALTQRLSHRIGFIHMPTIPEHDGEDFAPLGRLNLDPGTKLFLGVIHTGDGVTGAEKRIRSASAYREDFGVAHFCGFNAEFQVDPEKLDDLLDLHAQAAEV